MLQTINGNLVPDIFALHKIYGKDNAAFIAEQLDCTPRAKSKLPAWVAHQCFFTRLSLEQSTSEIVSNFKATLFCGKHLLSIGGGLGVDEVAFSKKFEHILSMDSNPELNKIARYNFGQLGIFNIERMDDTAENFLENTSIHFDMVYADPDRRAGQQRETTNAAAYSPDIFSLCHLYRALAPIWVIKLSPMVDLTWIRLALNQPCRIYVIAYHREIKELLVEIGPEVVDENIVVETGTANRLEWKGEQLACPDSAHNLVFIPSSAVVKASYTRSLARIFQISNLNNENSLFAADKLLPYGLGRSYRIVNSFSGSVGAMAKFLKEQNCIQANIICRNFTLKAPELYKKLKLKGGGDTYLVFTKDTSGKGLLLLCSK